MGSTKRNNVISGNEDQVKIVVDPEKKANSEAVVEGETETVASETKAVAKKLRSKKYLAVRGKLDKTKLYSSLEAIALVKKLSYTKFTGTISAHLVVKEVGEKVNIKFPNSTGKTIKAAIFDENVLAQLENNVIDFDVLLASPKDMAKLTKFARVLGPKGLMPNPKNGTLTPNPELKKKELEGGKVTIKTEKKAPLMHVVIGKTNMEDQALVENLSTLFRMLRGKVVKASVASTMSPGVKVVIEE